MFKRKINKEAFDKLSDAHKEFYEEKSGSYLLKVEDDDADELRRAKDREVQARKDAEKKAKELQEQLDEATGNDAKKRGDIEVLDKSWKEKFEKQKTDYEAKLATKDTFIRTTLVDSVANSLASKISNAPAVLLPHIKARLTADLDGEQPATKILDKDGKVSAMSVEDLEKEFVANKDFSSIIVGSKASGSGTSKGNEQQKGQGGAPLLDANGKPKPYRDMSPEEKVAFLDAKKETTN